jgi:hypothetical protein
MSWNRKKRNLLLKKCHLASVQREIQVLQSQDIWQAACWWLFWLKDWLYLFILKHTQFIAFIKRSAENYPAQWCWRETFAQSIWTSILRRCTEASQLCTQCRQHFAWCSKNFLKKKILYIMQFLMRNHKMHDTDIRKLSLWEYLMRVLHQLSSQSCWRLSESVA